MRLLICVGILGVVTAWTPRAFAGERQICARTQVDSVADATIRLSGPEDVELHTDEYGCADLPDTLAAGSYRLEVSADGYALHTDELVVAAGAPLHHTVLMTLVRNEDREVIVVEGTQDKPIETRHSLDPETIRSLPGASGDALKAIQNLPGLARTPFISGAILVRGAAPEDSPVMLDGQTIPQLYHFGALTSVIATEIIDEINFMPGGFGVRYGRAMGGVVAVESRSKVEDSFHGSFDVDLYDASAIAHARVGDVGSVSVAGRRSYVDALLPAVMNGSEGLAFTVAPRYYDYQLRYQAPFAPGGATWNVFVYGVDDAQTFVLDDPPLGAETARGEFYMHTQFHRVQGGYTRPLGGDWNLDLKPGVGWQRGQVNALSLATLDAERTDITLRAEATGTLTRHVKLLVGIETFYELLEYSAFTDGEILRDVSFDEHARYPQVIGAGYVEAKYQPAPSLELTGGIRSDTYGRGPHTRTSVDPRLSVRFTPQASAGKDWFLKGYVGLYHQPPTVPQWDARVGNPHLKIQEAVHVGLGSGLRLDEGTSLEAEVFAKWMSDLVVEKPGDPNNPLSQREFTSDGIGRAYGAELLLRRDITDRLYGWIAYTLSRSERLNPYVPGGWVPFDYDQTHILTTVASVRLGRGWEAGARFRYVTGNPDTEVEGAIYDADYNVYIPVPGEINGTRLPSFNQLDVRISKRWELRGFNLDAYLDVQNVYNRANPEAATYDFDYSNRFYISGLPVFPSIGIRGEF